MAKRQDNTGVFRRYVVEFLGTFFLVMTICLMAGGNIAAYAPVAAGVMLVGLIYAGQHLSGGHYNPAVSLAAYLRGKLDAEDILPYMIAQFLGGTLAAMLSGFLLTAVEAPEVITRELEIFPSLIAEFLGALLFVYVVLNIASSPKADTSPFSGMAIGLTYMACLFIFGLITPGAFNPAVALSITMANIASWSSIWIFLLANFAGGVVAAFLSQYVHGPYD